MKKISSVFPEFPSVLHFYLVREENYDGEIGRKKIHAPVFVFTYCLGIGALRSTAAGLVNVEIHIPRRHVMIDRKKFALFVLTVIFCLGLLVTPVSAKQSFTLINHSPCIIWIQIRSDQGSLVIAKALVPNEMFTRENRGGNGISRIQAGPTCAVDDCCYIKKIDFSPNVQGTAWRVDIYGDRLEVYDCTTWTKVASATGNMTNCPSCNKTNAMVFGAGTGPTETRGTE